MDAIAIIPFSNAAHRAKVVALWEAVFGYEAAHNQPALVIDKKLAVDDGLFLSRFWSQTWLALSWPATTDIEVGSTPWLSLRLIGGEESVRN